jgi:hypothetical protein
MANFGNFDIVKNQQLTGRRTEQKRQFLGFSTGSLSYWNIWKIIP